MRERQRSEREEIPYELWREGVAHARSLSCNEVHIHRTISTLDRDVLSQMDDEQFCKSYDLNTKTNKERKRERRGGKRNGEELKRK